MKRLHVHVSVEDIAQSVRFYSTLFAAEPTVTKPDDAPQREAFAKEDGERVVNEQGKRIGGATP